MPAGCAAWTISTRLTEKLTQKTKLASGLIENVVYQDNHLFYDAQNRLRPSFDGRTDVRISYDLAGNRSQVKTSVINNLYKVNFEGRLAQSPGWYDQVDNASVTTYAYDAMNRQTVSREEQTQKIGLDPKATTIVTTLTHNYAYDLAGNRVSDLAREQTSGKALQETVNNYVYDDLHRLDSFSISQSGKATQSGQILYDGAGRQVYAKTLSSTGEAEHRYNQYDTLGRVQDTRVVMRRADNQSRIQHTDVAYHGAPGTTDPSLGYDAAGNLRGQVQTTNGNTGDATRTTYKYQFNGSYQQTESTTTQGGRTATTNTWRDANGFISNIEQKGEVYDTRYNRAFVNDAQGNALYVNQSAGTTADKGGRIQNEPGGYIGGFIGDAINPGHIQRQLVANGEVLARYGDAPDSENPPKAGDVPKYVNTAEFHLNAPALKLRDTNFSAMSYTVVGGETLKTIARNVLGDSSLWWRIAEANGLAVSGDGELTAGQTLSIPKLALNANNADTFQPYDPSRVTGSLDSVLPAPAAQSGGCGGLGKIIMVAVAVVVAAYTAGTFSALLGNAWAGAAAAGATGSIASQVAGNVMGVQDGFNWKSVGLSALSAGITSGLAGTELFGGSGWQATAMRAATANVMTQGIGVLTGLQDRFDWKSVAASAAGGAVGSYVGEQLKTSTMFSDWGKTAADLARGTISGFAAGTAAAVARGGRISIQQVATDAFGNALGSSLAATISSPDTQENSLYNLSGAKSGQGLQAPEGWGSSGWSGNSARYDQIVSAFSNPVAVDRSNDVLLAAGMDYNGGIPRIDPGSIDSIRQADGSYRVEISGRSSNITGPSFNGISANAGIGTYDDPRSIAGPTVVLASDANDMPYWQINNAGNGLRAPSYGSMTPIGEVEGFFTFNPAGLALKGAGNAAFDAWTTLPNALSGLGTLAGDAYGYASNAIAPQRSVLTGQSFAYQPKSTVLQSIQQQGVLGTLGAGITGAVRSAPGIGLIGALGTPSRNWEAVGAQIFGTVTASAGIALGSRGEVNAGFGLTELDPILIRTTQTTVKQQGATIPKLVDSMRRSGFVVEPDRLIDVVRMPDGGLTSLDNTRILAAQRAGVNIQARVFDHTDLLPNDLDYISRFIGRKNEVPVTYGDAVRNRISNQGSLFRNLYPNGSPYIGSAY